MDELAQHADNTRKAGAPGDQNVRAELPHCGKIKPVDVTLNGGNG
ncbi:hypothetical protein ACFWFU_05855 [Streptomyces sp. NPDC060235]